MPQERKHIYTVTARDGLDAQDRHRCFGWFSRLKRAQNAVENNELDIYECSNVFAIIERVSDGIHNNCSVSKEWWYRWVNGKYQPIEKPKEVKHVVGWSIG